MKNPFSGIDLKNFSYDSYWSGREVSIRNKLLEREQIFFDWIEEGSSVLDIAAGNSKLPSLLKEKKGCKVSVMDISMEAIKKQTEMGVSGSISDLSSEEFSLSDHYDYIIASEILEHLSRPENLLKKIIGKTNFLVISVPNSAFYKFRLRLLFGRFFKQWIHHPSEHLRFWSHVDFLDWLESMDLEVVKYEASNGLDIGPIKFFKFWPNIFGHQICYLAKDRK